MPSDDRAQPPRLDDEQVQLVLGAAIAAPSVLNTQPWSFRVVRGEGGATAFEVYRDTTRTLPVTDPQARELTISCGAAVFDMRLALRHLGWESVVVVLPDPGDAALLARVEPIAPYAATGDDEALFDAIWRRHTNRNPFTTASVPTRVIDALEQAAAAEGAILRVLPRDEAALLAEAVREADDTQRRDDRVRAELAAWVSDRPGRDDGVPVGALGPRPAERDALVRDLAAGERVPGRPTADFGLPPTLALLSSRADEPSDWLRAGQALQRVLLLATVHDVAVSFLNQPVELDRTRWRLRDPTLRMPHAQMVLRLGYAPAAGATPRRPISGLMRGDPPDG